MGKITNLESVKMIPDQKHKTKNTNLLLLRMEDLLAAATVDGIVLVLPSHLGVGFANLLQLDLNMKKQNQNWLKSGP